MVINVCCIFFFCKQKTAYEMRISDWSSDVCSSDLRFIGSPTMNMLPGSPQRDGIALDGVDVVADSPRQLDGRRLLVGVRPQDLEIGRASCRERVCQDV